MIIECQHCDAKVDAKIIAHREFPPTDDIDPYRYLFMECPVCSSIMLGWTEPYPVSSDRYEWTEPTRLYPDLPSYLDEAIPKIVRNSLIEAKKCINASAYSAAAVMCGRAIEAICVEKVGNVSLAIGLKKLRESNLIDQRLFDWGEALRKERNIGAHASEEITTKADVKDIFDFAKAFCDYIYVLSEKYEEYLSRKKFKK